MTQSLENFILSNFGSKSYWVIAEVAKKNEKGGHVYLELVDSDEGRTTALMSATIWSSAVQKIKTSLGADYQNILVAGNKVLFQMRIEYHKIYGLKLNVLDIDPSFSFGEIEKQKQETIEKLKAEGLFDLQRELYLPVLSKKIALIGSAGTAGYRDFVTKLTNNTVYRNFQIKEFQASVQGDKAAAELIEALKEARSYDVDAIVMLRGGGSKMDLNVFNNYDLSKEICLTKVPVITGIGHEYDEVVADLVCRKMCITPTAAAEFLYIQIGTFSAELKSGFDAIINYSRGMLGGLKDEFYHVHQYLLHNSKQFLLEYQWALKDQAHELQNGFLAALQDEKLQVDLIRDKVKSASKNTIALELDTQLPSKLDRLLTASGNYFDSRKVELENLGELLDMLNPQRLLESGYTISTVEDIDINKSTLDVVGKEMKTLSSIGLITSTIEKIDRNKKNEN